MDGNISASINLFIENLITLFNLLGVYLLLGIFITGLLSVFISKEWIAKHLQSGDLKTVFKASLFGIPLPLCSCGVLPMAMRLDKMGANRSSVMSFLISTPMTGVDAIAINYMVFGLAFTVFSVSTAFISAMVVGLLTYFLLQQKTTNSPIINDNIVFDPQVNGLMAKVKIFFSSCDNSLKELVYPMLIGIVLATIIMTIFPTEDSIIFHDNIFISYLILIVFAIPIYVCSISVVPLAVSLYFIGFSPGAILTFVLVAPVISVINISVLLSFLTKKEVTLLLVGVSLISMAVGLSLDYFYPLSLDLVKMEQHSFSLWQQFLGATLAILFLWYGIKKTYDRYIKKEQSCCSTNTKSDEKSNQQSTNIAFNRSTTLKSCCQTD